MIEGEIRSLTSLEFPSQNLADKNLLLYETAILTHMWRRNAAADRFASRETYVLHKSSGARGDGNFLPQRSSSLKFELVLKGETRKEITEKAGSILVGKWTDREHCGRFSAPN